MYQNCSLILKFHLHVPGPTNKISTENRQSISVYCSMLQCLKYSPHTRHLQHIVHCAAVCRVWSHTRHLEYVLRRVAVCCSALQCVIRVQRMLHHVTYGPHTGPLQYMLHCVALCCGELAVRCIVLHSVPHRPHAGHLQCVSQCAALCGSMLQCVSRIAPHLAF